MSQLTTPIPQAVMHIEQSDPSLPRWLIKPMVAFARVANPWLLRVAGHSGVPIAAVHHLGRRSGRRYANPVTAFPTSNGFVISLPYGSGAVVRLAKLRQFLRVHTRS